MSLPIALCLLAALFYSAEIVFAEKKMPTVSPIILTFFFGLGICCYALPFLIRGAAAGTLTWPQGNQWWWLLAIPLLSFLADWAHFGAINQKAGGVVLATFYMSIPMWASIMKLEMPTKWKLVAWALGIISLVILALEGELDENPPVPPGP